MDLLTLKREIDQRGIILYRNNGGSAVQYRCKRYVPIKIHNAIARWNRALSDALLQTEHIDTEKGSHRA